MKFTLTQKGIILISIPLIFELLFVGTLYCLLTQAEDESRKALQASRIGDCSNALVKDMFELTSMTRNDVIESFSSNSYQEAADKITADLKALQEAATNDPAQERVVKDAVEAGEESLYLLEQLHKKFQSENLLSVIDKVRKLRDQLRSCAKRILSRDLMEMALKEKQTAEISRSRQLTFRSHIKALLILGLFFSIAIAIGVVLTFSRKIVRRVDTVIDNNFRLLSGLPLNPPIEGSDEIAKLDATFHELADALTKAKQKERAMIEHSADAICSLDDDGKITVANPACERIFQSQAGTLSGRNLRSMMLEESLESFNKGLLQAKASDSDIELETRIRRKENTSVDILWSIHWVESENSFFCVGHDITARKEMERLKQNFMAMISHDLRTPLATINNYLEMLNTGMFGELTERGEHLLKIAERNAHRMLCLINDLLDLEKAEFGGLKIETSTQNLDYIIDSSIKTVSDLASRKQIIIETNPTNLQVRIDTNRISQVLINLLSNAIKFSPENSVIKVGAEPNHTMALVHVCDQGRGIPEQLKETIFDKFQQVEIADAVDQGGSGLGLAICKTLVELHGGKISVSNNADRGSTFTFSVPLDKA